MSNTTNGTKNMGTTTGNVVNVSSETKEKGEVTASSGKKEETWVQSPSKHIYFVSETDQRTGKTTEIGYCRTRAEADHLIYDHGMKQYEKHRKYREEKKKYNVTYAYYVEEDTTRYEIKEQSLGYLYDGKKENRFVIKYTKLYRSYNSLLSPTELETMKKKTEEKD